VTQLLKAWSDGDEGALEQLIPLEYAELHRLAKRYAVRERSGSGLQTTALIHEAYLRLAASKKVNWQNRTHLALDETIDLMNHRGRDLIALDDALESLAELDERQSRIVELRFFGGLTEEETAGVLRISPRTVRREWTVARAWLYRALRDGKPLPRNS